MSLWESLITSLSLLMSPSSINFCIISKDKSFYDCRNRGSEEVPYDVFDIVYNYKKIKLGNNPYTCDCSLVWFMRELNKEKKKKIGDLSDMKCASPKNLAGRRIVDLKETDVCSKGMVSKSRCKKNLIGEYLDCSEAHLKFIPFDVFDTKFDQIYLAGDYNCDCNIVWYMRQAKDKIMDEGSVQCNDAIPGNLSHALIMYLEPKDVCPQKGPNWCNKNPRPCDETYSKCVVINGFAKCIDIDECTKGTYKCEDGEECENLLNKGYKCTCRQGLVKADNGVGCVVPVNQCTKKPNPCDQAFQVCVQGKTLGSYICQDIDECETNKHNCHKFAQCINTSPGYTCNCKPGFKKYNKGRLCRDINECSSSAKCSNNAKCVNTIGSYKCYCNDGYYGDGTFCEDLDECSKKASCAINAKCVNTQGSYQCICDAGYHGNGKICRDVDECTRKKTCPTNAECINTIGSYKCTCKSGYSWNGEHCVDVNECVANTHTCDKNAVCTNNLGGYKCRCKQGFEHFKEGRFCVKEESWMSTTNLIILAAGICLLVSVAFSIFVYKRKKRKKNEKNATGNEQTSLLLEQQNMFMFDDYFTDIPINKMPKISAIASVLTEWSEDEDDVEG